MRKHEKKKVTINFKSENELKKVQEVLNEADEGINDKSRTVAKSTMSELLNGILDMDISEVMGLASIVTRVGVSRFAVTGGLTGIAGFSPLFAPVTVVLGVGFGVAKYIRNKKLKNQKELCYKEAIKKQNAIIQALKEESDADKERLDYLNSMNKILQAVIKDLKHDLDVTLSMS